MIDPFPSNMVAPVDPLQSLCVANDTSTQHLRMLRMSALGIRGTLIADLTYISNIFDLAHSSSSGSLPRVARTAMVVWTSFLALVLEKIVAPLKGEQPAFAAHQETFLRHWVTP
jgi:hypothetical protein